MKNNQTKEIIFQTALQCFAQSGFQNTTMREIAMTANVAVGGSYYYFKSKEEIVLELYRRLHREFHEHCRQVCSKTDDFEMRLREVVEAHIKRLVPYKELLVILAQSAGNPQSSISPFHETSLDLKNSAIGDFHVLATTSTLKLAPELQKHIGSLLWLFLMGIIFFWLYDQKPGFQKTKKLIENSIPLITGLLKTMANPLLRPWRKKMEKMLQDILGS